jgi:hypothetical protein
MGIKDDKGSSGTGDKVSDDVVEDKELIVDDASGDDDDKKTVSHSTYKKTVAKEKAARERARIAEEKLTQAENDKLAAEGDKDKKIESLSAKLNEATKKQKDLYGAMARKTLGAQVKSLAAEAGCIDPDAVMALANLSDLEIDAETFEADPAEVKQVIADLKKGKPYLFSKAGPKVNGRMPNGRDADAPEKEDLSKLSTEQLKERVRAMDKKGS